MHIYLALALSLSLSLSLSLFLPFLFCEIDPAEDITWDLRIPIVVWNWGFSNVLLGNWLRFECQRLWPTEPKVAMRNRFRQMRIWCTKWTS